MSRKFVGQVPDDAVRILFESPEWCVYERPNQDSNWVSLKLVAKKPQRKANYWTAWNRSEQRIRRDHDAEALATYLPGVYAWLIAELTKLCGV